VDLVGQVSVIVKRRRRGKYQTTPFPISRKKRETFTENMPQREKKEEREINSRTIR